MNKAQKIFVYLAVFCLFIGILCFFLTSNFFNFVFAIICMVIFGLMAAVSGSDDDTNNNAGQQLTY